MWSVIAAAFIGPGTVATAASAGAEFGYSLLWALVFSTVACVVLQEASARLRVVSGLTLGSALRRQHPAGPRRWVMTLLVLGAIVVGCAAYQAGNILGGVAGAMLAIDAPHRLVTLGLGLAAGLLLWFQAPTSVARLLSVVVSVMGIAFLVTALRIQPPLTEMIRGALVPSIPQDAGILVLGLIGTTVVPYNLFLGSALAAGEDLREMRLSLCVAIGFGGIISMGVLIVGTAVDGPFSFDSLATVLSDQLGPWASRLFALGLLGAGFSSAVTAPLAAAVTVTQIFGEDSRRAKRASASWRYRTVWLAVLATGLAFGLSDVRPIPAILLAQALNGVLLPIVSIFLLKAVNDARLMSDRRNGWPANLVMVAVVFITLVMGMSAIARVATSVAGSPPASAGAIVLLAFLTALGVAWSLYRDGLRRPENNRVD